MDNDSPKFSGWFDDIIKVASSVTPIILGGIGGGGAGGGQAKGLAAITAFCQRVLGALDQAQAEVAAMPVNQRTAAAQQIAQGVSQLVASLSDSAQVYQAKKGRDAEVLAKAKVDADAKARAIIAMLNAGGGGGGISVTTGGSAGQPSASGGVSGGVSGGGDNTLLYLALGVMGILLITRR